MQDVSIDSLSIEEVELIEKLCLFERCFRSGKYGSINAFNFIDEVTLNKIKQMLYRSKHFFDQYGKPAIIDYHCFISEKTPVDSPADYFNKKIEDLHAQKIGEDGKIVNPEYAKRAWTSFSEYKDQTKHDVYFIDFKDDTNSFQEGNDTPGINNNNPVKSNSDNMNEELKQFLEILFDYRL